MRGFDRIKLLLRKLATDAMSQPSSSFTCGDCERNAQCGLPPHDDCVDRAMQIARDGEPAPRRPSHLHPAVWPR